MTYDFSSMFKEDDNKWSFARVTTFFILCCVLSWDFYIVWTEHKIPNLADQALFVPILYFVNKASVATTEIATGKTAENKS